MLLTLIHVQMLMSQDDDGCSIKWQASPRQQSATPAQVSMNQMHASLD